MTITDDAGYGDVGAYGAPDIRTPNIDQLASEGVKLTDFYADPVCTSTRAALIMRRCQNHGSQKIVGSAPAKPAYGRSGIRHRGGLSLEEAVVWNVGTFVSMLTEKFQVA